MTMMYAYRATERGIRERNIHLIADERTTRLAAQRAAWEAEQEARQAEQARIDLIRAEASERAKAYAHELKRAGVSYRPTVAEIERRACKLFGCTKSQLHNNRRHREIIFARQFVMYWAVRLTKLSLPQIGRLMGNRDHTTVIHGRDAYPQKRVEMGRYLRPAK